VKAHFNAILSDIDFEGCRTPVRVASSGRFLLRRVRMGTADGQFPCDGPRFSAVDEKTRVVIHMTESTVEGCRHGIRFGRAVDGVLSDSRISACGLRGVLVAASARVSVEATTIEGNGGSGSVGAGFGGAAVVSPAGLDLGGGALEIDGAMVSSAGGNSLCGNLGPDGGRLDLESDAEVGVAAAGNWWCSVDSPVERIVGPANIDPVLERAPLPRRVAR
jgi:hypothetical protein